MYHRQHFVYIEAIRKRTMAPLKQYNRCGGTHLPRGIINAYCCYAPCFSVITILVLSFGCDSQSLGLHQLTHIAKMVIDSMVKRRSAQQSKHTCHRPWQHHQNNCKWIVVIENWFATSKLDCVRCRILICILNTVPEWMPEPSRHDRIDTRKCLIYREYSTEWLVRTRKMININGGYSSQYVFHLN